MHFRGVSRSPADLHWAGRKVIVHGFPIGIEPEDFRERMESEGVKRELENLRKNFEGQKIVLGVDRLDYIKGIPQKLRAFDRFLTEHPEWVGKVNLIQLAIPTRAEVTTYQRLREEVEGLVGHINGKHGRFPPTFALSALTLFQAHSLINQSTICTGLSSQNNCVRSTPSPMSASSRPSETASTW
jgi:trehalose-6-phosphate synthase